VANAAGEQVMEEFHHNVSKPWIERLKRVDADTQKALDLDATVSLLASFVFAGLQPCFEHSLY
jgi:hypothetical protein